MYVLIAIWLGTAPSGVGAGTYEKTSTLESCEARMAEVMNVEYQKARVRKDGNMPLMRCVLIS